MSSDELKDYIKEKKREDLVNFVSDFVKKYRYKKRHRSYDKEGKLKISNLHYYAHATTIQYDGYNDTVLAEYDLTLMSDLLKFAYILFELDGEDIGIFNNFSQEQKFDFSQIIRSIFPRLRPHVEEHLNEDFYLFGYRFGGLLISYYCERMQQLVDDEIKIADQFLEFEKSTHDLRFPPKET